MAILYSLAGVELQVQPDGFSLGSVEVIQKPATWLTRDTLAGRRLADDSTTFEVSNILGQRRRIQLSVKGAAPAVFPSIPLNNDGLVEAQNKNYIRTYYSITGAAISDADIASLLTAYQEQLTAFNLAEYWKNCLNDPNVSYETAETFATSYATALSAWESLTAALVSPAITTNVHFSPSDGFTYTSSVDGYSTSFSIRVFTEVEVSS